MFVVFDLDGTLCDATHRLPLILNADGSKRRKPDWDGFYALAHLDEPRPEVLTVLRYLLTAGLHVEIWTGRRESTRGATMEWLDRHFWTAKYWTDIYLRARHASTMAIRMRKDGDKRPAEQVKSEYIDLYGTPDLVFEDESRCVSMYRKNGIVVADLAGGNYS